MKSLLVVVALAVAVAAYEPIFSDYHEEIGIPEAARIKLAESALDFDGSRITGGQLSSLGANPHLGGLVIALTDGRQSVCGSCLVSSSASVTAAHCWSHGNNRARELTVVLGSILLFSGGTRVSSSNVVMHANYNQNNLNNDVAVIRFSSVTLNNNIQPISLATGTNTYAGSWAVAAGHGRTSDTSGVSNDQRHVSLQVITNFVCRLTYGSRAVIASTLCVGTNNGRSTCNGDSGGPLSIGTGSSRLLIGIVSFGSTSGCTRGFPIGFARVTSFASWINARI